MKIISQNSADSVSLACQFLREGKAISFATDTVYGIAVDATNEKAVELLYQIKKRDPKKPVAVFLKDVLAAKNIFYFDEIAEKIAAKLLPGSLTLVLKQRAETETKIAKNLNSDAQNFLGFRVVDCDFVKKLMTEFDGILAVTSANPAGETPAMNVEQLQKYFANSALDLIIDGGNLLSKNVSTVVKIFDGEITILRHGAIAESLIKTC